MIKLSNITNILSEGKVSLCDNCNGKGHHWDNSFGSGPSDQVSCELCNGIGRIKNIKCTGTCTVPYDFTILR